MRKDAKGYAVVGDPVAHSLSPIIHQGWMEDHQILSNYERVRLVSGDAVEPLRELSERFSGLNITVPHKAAALACAASASELAKRVNAANTLSPAPNGGWKADNTDAPGFVSALEQAVPSIFTHPPRVVMAGAGGSARAIIAGLIERGVTSIAVCNRTLSNAAAATEGWPEATNHAWEELPDLMKTAELFINTTTLEMGQTGNTSFPVENLPSQAVVAEIVYAPLETPLLRAARQRGLKGVDGLGMLVHQAALAFEIWFAVKPDTTKGRARALRALGLPEDTPPC
jgi:shikimate dehydrogenase